jgi:hypothetical protein
MKLEVLTVFLKEIPRAEIESGIDIIALLNEKQVLNQMEKQDVR